jgi:UPF0716 protein FxsA
MNPFPWLVGLLVAVPMVEIYLLIKIGVAIGAWPTVALVILTAVLGVTLLRQQGFSTMRRLQASLGRGEVPAVALLEAVALLVGGVLLVTPGFVTDALGLLCLLPPTRRGLIRSLLTSHVLRPSRAGLRPSVAPGGGRGRVIEGEVTKKSKDHGDWP